MKNTIDGISIVIPALNEENAIQQTVQDCFKIVKEWQENIPCEVVVVDDGSSDQTAAKAKSAGAKVISHPTNAGYGYSLKDGINAATYDTIVITDADGTYPLNDMPKLLEQYIAGFDMVVGARKGEFYRQSSYKSLLRHILKFLVEWSSGKPIDDINSGFRVFSKNTISKFYSHLCDTFSFTTSVTLAYMMNSLFVAYVPTDYHQRVGTSHVRLFKDSLRTISYILKQILYFDPLKIFFLFSALWLVFACMCFLLSTLTNLNVGYYVGIMSVFGSFLILAFGLIAEQVRQLILSVDRNSSKK